MNEKDAHVEGKMARILRLVKLRNKLAADKKNRTGPTFLFYPVIRPSLCGINPPMCGIAGQVSIGQADRDSVVKMVGEMVHRGPDDGAVWSENPHCVLGHRRLRILDLSPTGAQPMLDATRGIAVVFNGEVFNFRELRAELEADGCAFNGTSDTEVILHGYRRWGSALVHRLRGMFAFAIWDSSANRLLLTRDRYGKKPLFYRCGERALSFASELNALLKGQDERLPISNNGFASYLRFGYVPGRSTAMADVHRLLPGETLFWESGVITRERRIERRPTIVSGGGFVAELHETLSSAVEDRLVSDVPLGCFLSGGIDSSLVVALARKIYGPGLKTFTVSFPGTVRDEGDIARRVADKLGTDHHQIDIHPADMESEYLATLAKCPEPLGDDSFIPTYFISRATRQHVTVALSGDGGDELFGGYPKYRQIKLGQQWGRILGLLPERCLSLLPDRIAKAVAVIRLGDPAHRALWLSSLWKENELGDLLLDGRSSSEGREHYFTEWRSHGGKSLQEQFSLTDIATYLEGSILAKVDRAGMAASLEVRSPLLDERILDLTLACGVRSTRLGQRKQALKLLLGQYLDLNLFSGPKRGFGLPIDEWFRGGLKDVLLEYTSAKRLRDEGLLNVTAVERIRDLHLSGRRNFGRKLHALVAWEVWREHSGV